MDLPQPPRPTRQEMRYRKYLALHIKGVKNAWRDIQEKMPEAPFVKDDFTREQISLLVSVHDASKYYPEEFDAYRQWFYPEVGEKKSEAEFKKAWRHHFRNNPHHAKYWEDKKFDISKHHIYLVEMVCDWLSMAKGSGRESAYDYFQKARTTLNLPPEAITFLEYLLITMDRR